MSMTELAAKASNEYRIVGPPGTGKTTRIKSMVAGWVERGDYEARDIMLTSFTRSAAAVLKGSVEIPRENISTLHALAFRAIGNPTIAEKGATAKLWDEQQKNARWKVGGATADTENGISAPDADVGYMLQRYSLARARQVPANHPLRVGTLQFATAWEDFKRETGSMDFTDLLEYALIDWDELPSGDPVFIIDEAQDMVPLQWALARQWGRTCEVFMACGDGAQVLYHFAGASPDEFMIDLPPGQQEILPRSYRMPPEVQVHAERYLKAHHSPSIMTGRTYASREGQGRVRNIPTANWRRTEGLMRELEGVIAEGRSVMVLASCGYMLGPILHHLREAGIPFHNPYRTSNGAWNPLGSLARSQTDDTVTSTYERVLSFMGGSLKDWPEMVSASEYVMRGAKKRIADEPSPDVFYEWAKPELVAAWQARDLSWLAGHVLKPYLRPVEYAASIIKKRGRDGLLDTPLVIPSTIHAAKGGEADVVIVFPDVSIAGHIEMNGSTEGRDAAVRLGYVALTRAREEVWLAGAADRRMTLW